MKKRNRAQKQTMTKTSDELTLRPWHEVARLYRERTGETLSRGGAWIVGMRAIAKMRKAFIEFERLEPRAK